MDRGAELRRYRQLGWPLFPLRAKEKVPATEHGFKDATTDAAAWGRWFSRGDLNIGLPTGVTSGIGVLDIDPRNGGTESLIGLEAKHGLLPKTVMASTGGGGFHLYFVVTVPLKTWKLAPGLDMKLDGGYVVVPPSVHPSGRLYAWESARAPLECVLHGLPSWCHRPEREKAVVIVHKGATDMDKAASRYFVALVNAVRDRLVQCPEGDRNNSLNRAAFAIGQLSHISGANIPWAFDCLRAAGFVAGLRAREIEATIESGFNAGRESPRELKFEEWGERKHG